MDVPGGRRILGCVLLSVLVGVPVALAGRTIDQKRIDFELTEGASLVKDQVSLTVEVVSGDSATKIPGYSFFYEFTTKQGPKAGVTVGACTTPFFRVTALNESDQTLKLRSTASGSADEVVVALDDDQGNTLMATRRQEVVDNLDAAIASAASSLAQDPAKALADFKVESAKMVAGVKFLTDDTTILPGRKATFLVCFDYVPGVYDQQEEYRWFTGRNELTLGIYDVPVLRDAAGVAQKKTNFQYKLRVHEYVDTMQYVPGGPPKTVVTRQVR